MTAEVQQQLCTEHQCRACAKPGEFPPAERELDNHWAVRFGDHSVFLPPNFDFYFDGQRARQVTEVIVGPPGRGLVCQLVEHEPRDQDGQPQVLRVCQCGEGVCEQVRYGNVTIRWTGPVKPRPGWTYQPEELNSLATAFAQASDEAARAEAAGA